MSVRLVDVLELWWRLKLDRILAWIEHRADALHKWGAK